MRPIGTPHANGLIAWCESIPEWQRGTLIEIGTYLAGSTRIFAQRFRVVHTINPSCHLDNGMYERMLHNVTPYPNIIYHDGFSQDVIPMLQIPDAYYIDGNHRYVGVGADIASCRMHSIRGTIIGGHDYGLPGTEIVQLVDFHFPRATIFEDTSWMATA